MAHAIKPLRHRKPLFFLGLVAGAWLLSGPAGAEIYKWVDADNEVQYTQIPPPPGVRSEKIASAPPPADNPETVRAGLQARLDQFDERREQEAKSAADAEKDAEIARIVKQNCEHARNNLAQLNKGGQIRYRTSSGEVLRLTDEDRQRRIEEANNQIAEFCKG